MVRESLQDAIVLTLKGISSDAGEIAFVVERPEDLSNGDYMTNVALVSAKLLKKNPH